MADIQASLIEIFKVEFNNNPDKFLHRNSGEDGWTLGGVYQQANPTQINWTFVNGLVNNVGVQRASRMLYYDIPTMEKVKAVYYNSYWSVLRLSEVQSQKIADEIFMMAVVSGVRNSAKIAQNLIGVTADGIVGSQTLGALNAFNEAEFSRRFDQSEIEYFSALTDKRPHLKKFLEGWKNRAVVV